VGVERQTARSPRRSVLVLALEKRRQNKFNGVIDRLMTELFITGARRRCAPAGRPRARLPCRCANKWTYGMAAGYTVMMMRPRSRTARGAQLRACDRGVMPVLPLAQHVAQRTACGVPESRASLACACSTPSLRAAAALSDSTQQAPQQPALGGAAAAAGDAIFQFFTPARLGQHRLWFTCGFALAVFVVFFFCAGAFPAFAMLQAPPRPDPAPCLRAAYPRLLALGPAQLAHWLAPRVRPRRCSDLDGLLACRG